MVPADGFEPPMIFLNVNQVPSTSRLTRALKWRLMSDMHTPIRVTNPVHRFLCV